MFNKLIDGFVGLLGNNFNDIIIAFLIVLSVYWFLIYDIGRLASIRSTFARLYTETKAIEGNKVENMKKLDGLFDRRVFPDIKDIWLAFYEDFRTHLHKEKTPDMYEYFDVQSAIAIPASRKKAEVLPGLLVMIGILGTFLGIAAGLAKFNAGTGGAASQVDMNNLLKIASSSFSISIAAIVLSVLFQLFDRMLYQSAVMQLNRFLNIASRRIPMTNDSLSLELLLMEQRSQTDELNKMGLNISSQLASYIGGNLVPSVNKSFEEAIKQQIAPPIKEMSENLGMLTKANLEIQEKGMQALAESFIEKLNTAMGGHFQTLGANIQGMINRQAKAEESINLLLAELAGSAEAQKSVNNELGAVLKAVTEYHGQVKDINNSLAEAAGKMSLFNDGLREVMEADKNSLDELNAQRLSMQQENKEYFEKMDTQVQRLVEDLSIQLDAAFSRFNDITGIAFERMEISMKSATEGMSANMKSLFDSMDDQVRDISLYSKGLSEEVNELNERLETSVKAFGEQMNNSVVNVLNKFDDGLSEICGRFGEVISDVKDAIEELPAVVGAIKSAGAGKQEMNK